MPEKNTAGETQEVFRSVFDLSPDSIVIADAKGTILLCNRKSCEISGYTYEELIGRNSLESVAPEELPHFLEELSTILVTGELRDRVYTYIKKDGARVPIEFTVRWLEDFPGIGPCSLTIGKDITARLQYEKAYETLLENILHGILVFQEGKLVYANSSALGSLGFTTQELAHFDKDELFALIHPEDLQTLLQVLKKTVADADPSGEFLFRVFDKSGQLHWIETSAISIMYQGKQALQISLLDTTKKKDAEEKLQKSLERYQALAETSPDGIYIIDREETHTYVNTKAAKMMGMRPEEIVGNPRIKFFPKDTAVNLYNARQVVFETGQVLQVEDQVPTIIGTLWFNTWFVPLRDEQGQIVEVMGIARNVDSQKKAELILRNAKDELEQHVAERTSELLASREQLKLLAKKVVTTQEDERRRVARELHNEAGQALIILKLELASLRDELVTHTPEIDTRLAKAMTLVDKTTNRIRDLSHSLHPPVLDIAGINLSLEDYCNEFASRTRIPVTYTGVNIPRLPEEISITLYRILQEALTNVAKHAAATEVKVILERRDKGICLIVHDNGRGFDEQTSGNGIGLLGMRERLGLLGGKLVIETRPDQGTNLAACIDWEEK